MSVKGWNGSSLRSIIFVDQAGGNEPSVLIGHKAKKI